MTQLNGNAVDGGEDSLTPAGAEQSSLLKVRLLAAAFIVGGMVMAYFTMFRPLAQAQQTGQLQYYMKGILFPPALIYLGVALLLGDFRDGQIRTVGPDGKTKLSRKGRLFMFGLIAVLALTVLAWHVYLKSIGCNGAFSNDFSQ